MRTLIFGHRGAKAYCPQNTLNSFENALDMGADGIELDIHMSKDGELVVFHDFELDHLTDASGPVGGYTASQLQKIEVLHDRIKGACIPTLEEVLKSLTQQQTLKGKPIYLNVEFKAGSVLYPGIEEKALLLCTRYLPLEQLIFSSFDHFALRTLKTVEPKAQIGVLTMEAMVDPHLYLTHLGAEYYHPNGMTLFPELLQQLSEKGVKVNPYTINDLAQAKALMSYGIFGIITDMPDKMVALREEVQHG